MWNGALQKEFVFISNVYIPDVDLAMIANFMTFNDLDFINKPFFIQEIVGFEHEKTNIFCSPFLGVIHWTVLLSCIC